MIDLNDVLLAMSNIPVDDPIAEIWGRGLQGGYKIIEYTGSLPITINANGDALIDYRIYGADDGVGVATESGEPTGYKLPMAVQSENLFDINAHDTSKGYIANAYLVANGNILPYSQFMISEYLSVQATSTYLFIGNNYNSAGTYIAVYNTDKDVIATVKINRRNIVPVYTPINAAFVRLSFSLVPTDTKKFVCVKEKNVYIGENQLDAIGEYRDYVDKASEKIVRKIVKIEFDGSEEWKNAGSIGSGMYYITVDNGINSVWGITSYFSKCSHYTPSESSRNVGEYNLGGLTHVLSTRWNQNIIINTGISSINEFKSYLYSQYEDGTPVTIWYVAEIPVEQDPPVPLPEIPTINGETIIDYDGTPKPSQMYVKYKGKSGGA